MVSLDFSMFHHVHYLPCYSSFSPPLTSCLDGHHVVFGEVVEGMDVVNAVEAEGSFKRKDEEQSYYHLVRDRGELC
ncbi:hypothetical protein K435DRAFT_423788 [Dendrothele bispora CBS 962.96]|uniref:PPIase cyclophilin-type domain-containing protein n=1 Tax=Dendrothele bispora (strain CBS 962.96) TaxID=1314807 RepID=A0A4S8L542_DENBC|nr:hypothetical protein K435DRAFT_423788 [Dendrothele bispora CBS 962.96]